tara:strand:- start:14744 stop:15046 length:303 start_codon:yes stop_codon:yes gene_type:complete
MNKVVNSKNRKLFGSLFFSLVGIFAYSFNAYANYQLVIGSYRQGPGSKPHVSGITSPSLFSIETKTLKQCQDAGKKISNEIYKPVWQFDNKWTCIYTGSQ